MRMLYYIFENNLRNNASLRKLEFKNKNFPDFFVVKCFKKKFQVQLLYLLFLNNCCGLPTSDTDNIEAEFLKCCTISII